MCQVLFQQRSEPATCWWQSPGTSNPSTLRRSAVRKSGTAAWHIVCVCSSLYRSWNNSVQSDINVGQSLAMAHHIAGSPVYFNWWESFPSPSHDFFFLLYALLFFRGHLGGNKMSCTVPYHHAPSPQCVLKPTHMLGKLLAYWHKSKLFNSASVLLGLHYWECSRNTDYSHYISLLYQSSE